MILRKRNWRLVGVNRVELTMDGKTTGHKTELLYRRVRDGKLKTKSIDGLWSAAQILGKSGAGD